jgi:hypothetical protein
MKKSLLPIAVLFLIFIISISSCKKDNKLDDTTWNVTANVDLSGSFQVIATAKFSIDGSSLTAEITTTQIGGAAESHTFIIAGILSDNTLTVTNDQFFVDSGSDSESVTITTGTHTIDGSDLTGSGTISVIPAGMSTAIPGTYTVTGSK